MSYVISQWDYLAGFGEVIGFSYPDALDVVQHVPRDESNPRWNHAVEIGAIYQGQSVDFADLSEFRLPEPLGVAKSREVEAWFAGRKAEGFAAGFEVGGAPFYLKTDDASRTKFIETMTGLGPLSQVAPASPFVLFGFSEGDASQTLVPWEATIAQAYAVLVQGWLAWAQIETKVIGWRARIASGDADFEVS